MRPDQSSFISRLCIRDVWLALGGPPLRGGRGVAWWRPDARHLSVSLDLKKGFWRDWAGNTGGGVLGLIETVLNCDRPTAIRWARDFAGLPPHEWTKEERRDYAGRRAVAEREAAELVRWRSGTVATVEAYRNLTMRLYHLSVRTIVFGRCAPEELGIWMERAAIAESKWLRSETALDLWRDAPWDQVLVMFREHRRAAS